MTSFGEALAAAFNNTYGTMARARYQNAAATTLERENAGWDAFKAETGNDSPFARPGQPTPGTPGAPQAPAAQPIVAPRPEVAAPAPVQQPAPQPPAQGALQGAVAPAPMPAAPPPQAPAPQGPAPQGAPGPMAAAAATPAPQPNPAPQGAQGAQGAEGAEGAGVPQYPPQTMAKIVEMVDGAKQDPTTAMVAYGAMAPPATAQEARELQQQVPSLVQGIAASRGEGAAAGPFTKADWNGYLERVSMSALRNLPPERAAQMIQNIDRVRVAGLQGRMAMAMAAAESGDMAGAANALNAANSFLPDGWHTEFRPAQGGVMMRRSPEAGTKGEAIPEQFIPQAMIQKYAMTAMDPKFSLQHFLNVDKHNEDVRHHKASEGLQAAGQQIQREGLALGRDRLNLDERIRTDQQELRRTAQEEASGYKAADAEGTSVGLDMLRAYGRIATAREKGDEAAFNTAQGEVQALREKFAGLAPKMTPQAQATLERLGLSHDKLNLAAGIAEGRQSLAEQALAIKQAQTADAMAKMAPARWTQIEQMQSQLEMPMKGDNKGGQADAARFASTLLAPTVALNPGMDVNTIARALQESVLSTQKGASPNLARYDAKNNVITMGSGVAIQLPPAPGRAAGGTPRTQGNLPMAGADTSAGGSSGSVQGARTPPGRGALQSAVSQDPAVAEQESARGSTVRNVAAQRSQAAALKGVQRLESITGGEQPSEAEFQTIARSSGASVNDLKRAWAARPSAGR